MVLAVFAVSTIHDRWSPRIPVDAGSTFVARTSLAGPNGPDGSLDAGPTPSGQQCLDRIERPSGPLDLCWEAFRERNDADPAKDYYHLRVYGSYGGESGTGVTWLVARAQLEGSAADGVFEVWPKSTFDGDCQPMDVIQPPFGSGGTEIVCGRTIGTVDYRTWTQTLTWTCEGCLFGSHATRGLAMYEVVGVPEGTIPSWTIGVDYGG